MRLSRRLQNLGLITLITLLIWLYAEAQNVRQESAELLVRLPDVIGQATVVDPTDRREPIRVAVELRGNSARLSELRATLAGLGVIELPLEAAHLPQNDAGIGPIDLRPLLQRASLTPRGGSGPRLADLGVSLDSVEPVSINVRIDQLVEKNVDVVFRPEGVQIDSASLKIDPPQVVLVLPQSLVEQYSSAQDVFKLEATVPQVDLPKLPPGVKQTVNAQLAIPQVLQSEYTQLKTNTVDVTFTIASQTESHVLGVVPVWLLAPPSELQRYQVTLAEDSRVLNDVTVTGPRQLVDQLRAGDTKLRVVGRIELTADDLDNAITSAPVSHIEIQEVNNGQVVVRHTIPLNRDALVAGADPSLPAFVSPTISVTTSNPIVKFRIQKTGE